MTCIVLFVRAVLRCKFIGNMTTVTDNLMKCVTAEITVERSKNILISFDYRTPGSCTEQFKKKITQLYEKHNKVIWICGDFNIDLLNSNDHMKPPEFLRFSLNFYQLILKPTIG